MKYTELIKMLKKHGIIFYRHGANHDIYTNPTTGQFIIVPRHKKEIPTGTAEVILKDAGITKR